MAENPTYNVAFRDTTALDSSNIQQIGVQVHNHYGPPAEDKKKALLNEFGPIDPPEERRRIIAQKNSVIEGSCDWVLNDAAFQQWQDKEEAILWISGGPGQGKTMIMDAVLSECQKQAQDTDTVIAYFFCQATDDRLSNTTAVLKGLFSMLVNQNPDIANHLIESYQIRPQNAGAEIALWRLWDCLDKVFDKFPNLKFCLFIDALDECGSSGLDLIDLVVQSKGKSRVRWLFTSRNEPDIKERLAHEDLALQISLEANMGHVTDAKSQFIEQKVEELQHIKNYESDLTLEVKNYLQQNAGDTFLWVAIVCQELRKLDRSDVQEHLHTFPTGLTPLYKRMIDQVIQDDKRATLCLRLLRTVAVVYRPQTTEAIGYICGLPESYLKSPEDVHTLLARCGSFLTIRDDHVYFIHQSAADFIIGDQTIFDSGTALGHAQIVPPLIDILTKGLKKDICGIRRPDASVQDIAEPTLSAFLPSYMQYACHYLIEHLLRAGQPHFSKLGCHDGGSVHMFLKSCLLFWIESSGWLQDISTLYNGLESLAKTIKEENCTELGKLVYDATCFLVEFRTILDVAPLQVYISGLIFSPQQSLIRQLFSDAWPEWLLWSPQVEEKWDPSSRSLEGHTGKIECLKFSPNGQIIASCSDDGTVRAWECKTGESLGVLGNLSSKPTSLIFSADSKLLIVVTENRTLHEWQFEKKSSRGKIILDLSKELQTSRLLISSDGALAAMACTNDVIKIWNLKTGKLQTEIEVQLENNIIDLSHNGDAVAYYSNGAVNLRSTEDGKSMLTLYEKFLYEGKDSVFSPNGKGIMVGWKEWKWATLCSVSDGSLQAVITVGSVLNLVRKEFSQKVNNYFKWSYSQDGKLIITCTPMWYNNSSIQATDTEKGKLILQTNTDALLPCAPATSCDNSLIAYVKADGIVVRSITKNKELYSIKCDLVTINNMTFDPKESLLAYDIGSSIKLFDASLGNRDSITRKRNGLYDWTSQVISSHSCKIIAYIISSTWNQYVFMWNLQDPAQPILQDLRSNIGDFGRIVMLPERGIIAINDKSLHEIILHDVMRKRKFKELWPKDGRPKPKYESMGFSSDGKQFFARVTYRGLAGKWKVTWDVDTGDVITDVEIDPDYPDDLKPTAQDEPAQDKTKGSLDEATMSPTYAAGKDLFLDPTYQWVTWKGQKLMWLPEHCRPTANPRWPDPDESFAAVGNCIVLSGRFEATWLIFDEKCLQNGSLWGTRTRPPPFSELDHYNKWKKGLSTWKRIKKLI